ncbi:hypothetical protein [Williamsia sterculiae]|uniref:Uncharacterized protein n=1 Tax=Williamsia sterculiae TaxID=1344003 RepID=A0A1N7GYP0_9NOCA|nr:hypothetical protein [Williamsia sterculiae]SIS17747.1 hypothetical protein SAMN05445060_3301 [Williamsia sterculiae]
MTDPGLTRPAHTPSRQPLPGWLRRRVARDDAHRLPVERAAARVSAFVYGNILVLAVVVTVTPRYVEDGTAVALVLGTTVSTWFAHVFAEWMAHGVHTAADGRAADPRVARGQLMQELRDSVPIVTSGLPPTVILGIAASGALDPQWAQWIAAGWIVARIAGLGVLVERVSSGALSWRTLLAGITVAVVATVITAVKILLTH